MTMFLKLSEEFDNKEWSETKYEKELFQGNWWLFQILSFIKNKIKNAKKYFTI